MIFFSFLYFYLSDISADLVTYILIIQDKDWDGEDSDEEDDSIDDLEVSNEDDSFNAKKSKGRQQGKSGRNVRPTRERISNRASNRQRRVKSSFEEEESSADDSDSESDEDFKNMTRRGVNLRKNGGQSTVSTNTSGRNSEIRTSSRSVRKVSYVESEESEEVDEGKKKKPQKVRSTYCIVKIHVFISPLFVLSLMFILFYLMCLI